MTELTHEELTRLLEYDPETGVFRRKVGSGRWEAGSVVGSNSSTGNSIMINGTLYRSRILAYFYIHGEMPRNNLFVKNGDRNDDRISNIGMLPDKPRELTHEYLKQCIDYNPDTGEFKWKITQCANVYGGDAFCIRDTGNNNFRPWSTILNKQYPTNRLIVFWMTGYMPSPSRYVMTIDNNALNLKWNNLKVGCWSDVQIKKRNTGSMASKGVSFIANRNKYRASIRINGKAKNLGCFKTEAEAAAAYMKAARKHYGELANDGYQHAMYEMDWEKIEQTYADVADELLASAEEAVGIINGTVKPGKVWVPPVVTEDHPVDF